jgi:hypothetical protein
LGRELMALYAAMVEKEHGQEPVRTAEDRVRHDVVAFIGRTDERGLTRASVAEMLCLTEPTMRLWRMKEGRGELLPILLGRPRYDCDSRTVAKIRELVEDIGYEVSVLFVAEKFPGVPRAVIEEIVRTFKEEVRRGRRVRVKVLTWEGPGRVWAMDWTDPEATIDGKYKKVLMVRDLAAKWNLLSLPAKETSGRLAEQAVEHLFICFGAPLVMKMDGGPEFKEKRFRKMLRDYGVTVLLSPGYYPQYNGAVEAGIGSLKTHTFYEAVRRGRNGCWTADDVEAGRQKANETSRPWGWRGPSPDQKWAGRTGIDCDEWEEFKDVLDAERKRWIVTDRKRDRKQWEAEERMAITSALDLCGYLRIGHRTTTLKVANG